MNLPFRSVIVPTLFIFLVTHGVASPTQQSTYRAAVVEFASSQASHATPAEALEIKLNNLAALASYAREAKANGSQIIVFPEYGITGDGLVSAKFNRSTVQLFVEKLPDNSTNPCLDQLPAAPAISAASCLARELQLVVVMNVATEYPCSPAGVSRCPSDGKLVHNSAVAIGEDGELLAIYHKRHLFGDEHHFMDASSATRAATFATRFGVTFGMLICFDILFEAFPEADVLDYVFPTDWVNDALGPLTPSARFAQELWSRTHGKNILAANYGGFGKESSGSAIWHRGSALASFFNPGDAPQSKLLIADVPALKAQPCWLQMPRLACLTLPTFGCEPAFIMI